LRKKEVWQLACVSSIPRTWTQPYKRTHFTRGEGPVMDIHNTSDRMCLIRLLKGQIHLALWIHWMTHGQHHNHMALRKSLPACHNIKNMQEFMVEADRITNLHNTFLL